MLFSAKAEYACLAMLELAARYGDPRPARLADIADKHGIPQRFLVQILLQLKGAGLVASSRGASGGYQLTKRPTEINLAEIIYSIDRAPTPSSALSGLPPSSVVQAIRLVWQEVSREELRILEKTTLAEVVRRSRDDDLLSYQI